MTTDDFSVIIQKIKPYTSYIYLHVLGEPLLHPRFDQILAIAEENNINVNITTNGTLIPKQIETLQRHPVRQINISLHDAEENIPHEKWTDYLTTILNFSKSVSANTYINLRLWNEGVDSSKQFNTSFLNQIATAFNIEPEILLQQTKDSGIKLADHIFFQPAPRFDWPDGITLRNISEKKCYALRDHVAVLVDGSVVPCCMDANAHILLGNILQQNAEDIFESERAMKIKNGFSRGIITEDFCKSCGFIIRK